MSESAPSPAQTPVPKDLLGLESLTRAQIESLLQATRPMKALFTRSIKKVPALRGKTVALQFFESRRAIFGQLHLEVHAAKHRLQQHANRQVIVDDEDMLPGTINSRNGHSVVLTFSEIYAGLERSGRSAVRVREGRRAGVVRLCVLLLVVQYFEHLPSGEWRIHG